MVILNLLCLVPRELHQHPQCHSSQFPADHLQLLCHGFMTTWFLFQLFQWQFQIHQPIVWSLQQTRELPTQKDSLPVPAIKPILEETPQLPQRHSVTVLKELLLHLGSHFMLPMLLCLPVKQQFPLWLSPRELPRKKLPHCHFPREIW